MQEMRSEYALRMTQEIKYAEALERTQEELATRKIHVQQLIQTLVKSDQLLIQLHRIQDLKEEFQKAQQILEIAKIATIKANTDYNIAQAAYFRLIAKIEVCKTEYKTLQTEQKRQKEQKSEQELDDNYCKQKGSAA